MGDYTELVLDGVICEKCGDIIDDFETAGYPRMCDICREIEDIETWID